MISITRRLGVPRGALKDGCVPDIPKEYSYPIGQKTIDGLSEDKG